MPARLQADERTPVVKRNNLDTISSVATVIILLILGWTYFGPRPDPSRSRPVLNLDGVSMTLDGIVLKGSVASRVIMVEIADFGCSFCARFAKDTLPQIEAEYVEPGHVLLGFDIVAMNVDSLAGRAGAAAVCAGQQGRFWDVHDSIFALSKVPTYSDVTEVALKAVSDPAALVSCIERVPDDFLSKRLSWIKELGLSGTPSFLFGYHQQGQEARFVHAFTGARSLEEFRVVLRRLLKQGGVIRER